MSAVMDIVWNRQQEQAIDRVAAWLSNPDKGSREPFVYRLFGYAGTGKTTLAQYLAGDLGMDALFAAFTGKAADRLAAKGCLTATTIHKLLYCPNSKSAEHLRELEKALDDTMKQMVLEGKTPDEIKKHQTVMKLENDIAAEMSRLKKPSWKLNLDSPLAKAKLLTVDEVSMVDMKMGEDLKSFGVPILVLGDPFQLPPLFGEGYFTKFEPDTLLTDVQRQAKDNPVLQMATMVREGKDLKFGNYGDSKVICKAQVDKDDVMSADQCIVGMNKTRKNYNIRMRQLLGRTEPLPSWVTSWFAFATVQRCRCVTAACGRSATSRRSTRAPSNFTQARWKARPTTSFVPPIPTISTATSRRSIASGKPSVSTTATTSQATRPKVLSGITSTCGTNRLPSVKTLASGSTPA
jgi:hypothetical protein